MKKSSSFSTLFLALVILTAIGIGCGKKDESPTPDNKQSTNTSANSSVNSSNSGSNSNSTSSTSSTSATKDISGNYAATGTNEGGKGNYVADLVVTDRDDVYQFSWDSKGTKYDGVGVQTDNKVAVSYTTGTDGKGCALFYTKSIPTVRSMAKQVIGERTAKKPNRQNARAAAISQANMMSKAKILPANHTNRNSASNNPAKATRLTGRVRHL